MRLFAVCLAIALPSLRGADPLTPQKFDALVAECAPGAPITALRAVARVESGFYPLALSVNYPERAATQLGLGEGAARLSRLPRSLQEALAWIRWLKSRKQTVSVGLMQINAEHAPALKVTIEQLFDPCTNIRAGWQVLSTKLEQARAQFGDNQAAFRAALSAYNTGNWIDGFANGYVERVHAAERKE